MTDIHYAQVEDEPYVQMAETKNSDGESWAYLGDAQGVIVSAGTLEELIVLIAANLRELEAARKVVADAAAVERAVDSDAEFDHLLLPTRVAINDLAESVAEYLRVMEEQRNA